MTDKTPDTSTFTDAYSETGFWDKLKGYAREAGRDLVEKALQLYYLWEDDAVPATSKAVILGALGYFIMPLDVIPDVLPGVGFTDDLAAVAAALALLNQYITDDIRAKVTAKAKEWFE